MGCCGASPTNESSSRNGPKNNSGRGGPIETGGDLENDLNTGISPESLKYYGSDAKAGIKKIGTIEYIKTDPLKNNFTSTINITSEFVNKKDTIIMNYNHEAKDFNLKEIRDFCTLYLDNEKIPFSFEYNFPKEGKYDFKFQFTIALLNTSNMFFGCKTLVSLDLSHFNAKFVKNFNSMFYGCVKLEDLNLSNFDTSHAITMSNMFAYCSSLKKLDCSSFTTKNVTTMTNMFQGCTSLVELNIQNFTSENITYMDGIFDDVKKKNCNVICNDKKILAELK